ncbi:MAG: hypothetical protein HY752_02660 [Nitrospirae bacterium]|nr:hypothetical protein [Nitrospirota bacterium]
MITQIVMVIVYFLTGNGYAFLLKNLLPGKSVLPVTKRIELSGSFLNMPILKT